MVFTWMTPKRLRPAVGQLIQVSRVESKLPDLREEDSNIIVSAQTQYITDCCIDGEPFRTILAFEPTW